MRLAISPEAEFILHSIKEAGFEVFVVGGAVRDLLLEQTIQTKSTVMVKDYDFTTDATPEQIQQIFPDSFYENKFGTVSITPQHLWMQMGLDAAAQLPKFTLDKKVTASKVIDLAQASKIHESLDIPNVSGQISELKLPNFEITTYRSGESYENFRHPSQMSWGQSVEEDLKRRDFTINALALDVEGNVIDPFDGQSDLETGVIRTVGKAEDRFKEDALRMLRAIRFSVQLNMKIVDESFQAIKANADLIRKISWERIGDEVMKMLSSKFPAEAIELLDETTLLRHIIPELLAGKSIKQGGHHTTDVWTHSLDALRECPNPDPVVRLATLLHDVAKPQTMLAQKNTITFYNHEIIGSRIASKIARRLRLSKDDAQRVFTLVRYHMFHYQEHNTDAAIRRFMRKVGLHNVDDILDLREADRLGSGARKTSWRLEEMKQRMIEQLHQPMDVTDLAIDGHVLMTELGLKPGPILGDILKALLEKVLDEPDLNQKDKLLEMSKKIIADQSL